MSGLGDYARRAEQWAEQHPKEADRALEEGEKAADERTGHRWDRQIGEGVDRLEDRLGGAGQGTQEQGTAGGEAGGPPQQGWDGSQARERDGAGDRQGWEESQGRGDGSDGAR